MTYGEALEAVKQGKRAQRAGWNGKRMFIFMRPGDSINAEDVQRIKTLPRSVIDWIAAQESFPVVVFTPYLCMKAADDSIVNGWFASQTDMLADDWSVLD